MKATGLILSITILITVFISCSGDDANDVIPVGDTIAPVITMLGKNPDTLIIKTVASYNDPGATALDNKDGAITSEIVVATNVNVNAIGTYLIYYNVEDAAHNTAERKTRVVEVISATALYDATSTCTGNTSNSVTITSYSNNDSIVVNDFYQTGTVIKAGLSNHKYVLAPMTLSGTTINGDLTASGTTLNGNYVFTGTISGNCTSAFIRH